MAHNINIEALIVKAAVRKRTELVVPLVHLRTQAALHYFVVQADYHAGVSCSRLQTCHTPLSLHVTAAEA